VYLPGLLLQKVCIWALSWGQVPQVELVKCSNMGKRCTVAQATETVWLLLLLPKSSSSTPFTFVIPVVSV
jgi:hypothetical protein